MNTIIHIMYYDIKNNTYIDSSKDVHDKDPKFEVGYRVRILKYFCLKIHSKLV